MRIEVRKLLQIYNYGIPTKKPPCRQMRTSKDHALPSTSSVCLVHSFRGGKRYALQKSKIHNLFMRMGDESLKTQQPHQELKAFTCQFSLSTTSLLLLTNSLLVTQPRVKGAILGPQTCSGSPPLVHSKTLTALAPQHPSLHLTRKSGSNKTHKKETQ